MQTIATTPIPRDFWRLLEWLEDQKNKGWYLAEGGKIRKLHQGVPICILGAYAASRYKPARKAPPMDPRQFFQGDLSVLCDLSHQAVSAAIANNDNIQGGRYFRDTIRSRMLAACKLNECIPVSL